MKKILRGVFVSLVLLFVWPFFLYKKYGNTKYKLTGRTVIISNHYATLDSFLIYLAFPHKKIRFVTIVDVKKKWFTRFLTWLFDCLYIDYNSVNLDFFKECIKILNDDGVICIFPEGEINPSKFGVFCFQGSFMYLAKKTGAKILPLYIYPRFEFMKKSTFFIGDEITKEEYSQFKTKEEAVNHVQIKVTAYSLAEYD